MSLFDAFKAGPPQLSAKISLPVALLFMMAADGHVDDEEIGQLKSVIGDDENLIKTAIRYLKAYSYEEFLKQAHALLSPQQKLCILLNITDSLMSDGAADPAEQDMLSQTMVAFGMSEDEFRPYFETILIKNNRSIF